MSKNGPGVFIDVKCAHHRQALESAGFRYWSL